MYIYRTHDSDRQVFILMHIPANLHETCTLHICIVSGGEEREREQEREGKGGRERAGKQADRQTDRQKDRQKAIESERERE
jgi:hypothetical protein